MGFKLPWVPRSRLETANAIIGGLILENDRLEAAQKPEEPHLPWPMPAPAKALSAKERVKPKRVSKNTAKYRRKAR